MTTPTSQSMLGNSRSSHTIECNGKTYRVGRLDHHAMNAFSTWLIRRIREQIVLIYENDRVLMKEQLDELRDESMTGKYDFLEEVAQGKEKVSLETRTIDGKEVKGYVTTREGGVLYTPGGMTALVSILCDCTESEAQNLVLTRTEEARHVLELVLAESLPGGSKKDDWAPVAEGKEKNPPGQP